MRDAAGELADRFHFLRLAQRFLGEAALVDLRVEALRSAQDYEQGQEEQQGGGKAEDEMRRHLSDPFLANGGGGDARRQIEGRIPETARREAPGHAVDGRSGRIEAAPGIGCDRSPESGAFAQLVRRARRRGWIAGKQGAVIADERIFLLRPGGECGVEIGEAARRNRDHDNRCERAVAEDASADGKVGLRAVDRRIDPAVIGSRAASLMGADEIPVVETDRRWRFDRGSGQGVPVGVVDPDRLRDRKIASQLS